MSATSPMRGSRRGRAPSALSAPHRAGHRASRRAGRRGRLLVLFVMLASAALVALDAGRTGPGLSAPPASAVDVPGSGSGFDLRAPQPTPPTSPTAPAPAAVTVVRAGSGSFAFAAGSGAVAGRAGALRRYRVAVEQGIGVDAGAFAADVEAILADPRGWIAGATVRLGRVAGDAPADFTIYLASPVTSERMCRAEWLETGQFTNCRLGSAKVIINSARWLTSVPGYGAPLATYRHYAINHEVGHELGHRHELCPGPGRPAPVMQQQTLGLRGCTAYGWPYLAGVRYQGPQAGH